MEWDDCCLKENKAATRDRVFYFTHSSGSFPAKVSSYQINTISNTLIIILLYSRELNHPNIVSLLAHCVMNDEIVLVMNFINGSNFDRILFSKNLHNYKEV